MQMCCYTSKFSHEEVNINIELCPHDYSRPYLSPGCHDPPPSPLPPQARGSPAELCGLPASERKEVSQQHVHWLPLLGQESLTQHNVHFYARRNVPSTQQRRTLRRPGMWKLPLDMDGFLLVTLLHLLWPSRAVITSTSDRSFGCKVCVPNLFAHLSILEHPEGPIQQGLIFSQFKWRLLVEIQGAGWKTSRLSAPATTECILAWL